MIAISLRPVGRKWGTVSFASTLNLCPVLDLLLADVPPVLRPDLRLGLQEALVNAVKHGNNFDPCKTIAVEFFSVEDQHWWVITDQGTGFAPGCTCDTNPDENRQTIDELNDCGRGLFILHQIFDQVHWNHRGTELRLCKQLKNRPLKTRARMLMAR
ncbi:MAG: anti-sigma regulatory factor [Drouetiella hepatica Uher 2000/2452]|uniref:Anti-sigma regulatory factor n=1 Tax=Drouetiella hepatica Uher 2000/2452 TaxID=904376 RepID=A0A951UQ85_9CYAN|nr:anti-sigma regulatory factor [Drouetiella hepatica Uher 2000/2452]